MNERYDEIVKRTIEAYDSFAREYAETWFHRPLEEHLRRFVGMLPEGKPVLDAGGGHGRDALALNRMGIEAVLLDLSTRLMVEGRRRGVRAPMVQADLRHIPFAEGAFGGVWACASLVHLPRSDVLPALVELRRVSSGDGALFVSMRAGEGSGWETLPGGSSRFYTYYTMDELLSLLRTARWVPARWQFNPPHWLSVWARGEV